ncbi:MAG: hypothetical protein L6W00_02900 [Lentisphaeria bacterium]|nr:MAG: hypothetical protein L6W00_02900 [Lentisphaeria bacterium]
MFATLPSSTGVETIAVRRETTRAARKVERTATGYRMTLEIPLDELPDSEFYGIDIEIDRPGEKEKSPSAAALGSRSASVSTTTSSGFRGEQKLHNTDFSDASYGDPAWWCYSITPGMTVTADGKNGVVITNHRPDKVAESVIQQQIPIPPGEVPQRHAAGRLTLPRRQSGATGPRPSRSPCSRSTTTAATSTMRKPPANRIWKGMGHGSCAPSTSRFRRGRTTLLCASASARTPPEPSRWSGPN